MAEERRKVKKNIIPPDGGWGWIIVLAYALNNLIMVPLIQGMGLVFKDVFHALKIPATDTSIIISVNMSFGMSMGLIHGPLLRIFGYRKIAIFGASLFVGGIFMTAFATNFSHFILFYGIITSLGIGLTMASFSLALNTYFNEKRGRAVGVAMTITGLGPILLPQLISLLSYKYTSQWTILILGALALHTLVASLLLQPVEWHAKYSVNELNDKEDSEIEITDKVLGLDNIILDKYEEKNTISVCSLADDKLLSIATTDEIKKSPTIVVRRDSVTSLPHRKQISNQSKSTESIPWKNTDCNQSYKWWNSGKSLDSVHLGSCPMIFDETIIYGSMISEINKEEQPTKKIKGILKNSNKNSISNVETPLMEAEIEQIAAEEDSQKPRNLFIRVLHRIVYFFDLNLLKDPIYVNIMLGMSIATFSEITFSVLTPFILDEIQFSTSQIAAVMSTIATNDLFTRGLSPYVGERLRQSPRVMYMASLVMLIASRTTLIFCTGFVPALIMAVGLGIAKGFRSVYLSLVLPSYIPLERLADATGLQTVVNGLILMGLGPIIGILREVRGNYVPCIILMNAVTGLTIIMWMIEMMITSRIKKRKELKKQQYEAVVVND